MNKTTSPEIATMAGRILAAGNPLDNDQVLLAVMEGIAVANTGAEAMQALKTMFEPYIQNALSLAGSCLSQAEPDQPDEMILVPTEIDYEKVANAFVGFIENGHSNWCSAFMPGRDDLSYSLRRKIREERGIWYAEASYWRDGGTAIVTYDPGDESDKELTVGKAEIKVGLGLMAKNAPGHFGDFINENDDAITHDVFAQFIILGEIVYG